MQSRVGPAPASGGAEAAGKRRGASGSRPGRAVGGRLAEGAKDTRARLPPTGLPPISVSCALPYWSVRREMTTVGSVYSR